MRGLKKTARRMISPLLLFGKNRRWKTQHIHVLIEPLESFKIKDWREGFDRYFPGWSSFVEIEFFHNFAERDVLLPGTNIYIGAWFSSDLLKTAPRLKLIQMVTAGVEFLNDLDAGDRVRITTASGISSRNVAEYVLMMMLVLDHRLDASTCRQGHWCWNMQEYAPQAEFMKGRTAGIIGLGNNGGATANLLLDAGMKVVGYDLRRNINLNGVKFCPAGLPELLALADFAVLCVPLTEVTRKMIGRKELSQMKKSAYLINVGRGGVIDEQALAEALRKRVIAGAGLDVLVKEPLPLFHPLRGCPGLIITPHVAGNINAHREPIMERFVRNTKAFLDGQPLEGVFKDY